MRVGIAGRIAHAFIDSKLTPLLIAASLGLGALALLATPREEEPQIRVPMVDVKIAFPGAEPAEVDSRVVQLLERAMWGLAGVEHVYSTAGRGFALVTVRFRVNESNEESLVKVYERLNGLPLPPGSLPPAVELHAIDDVPFLALTLWSPKQTSDELRPLAAELAQELSEIEQTSQVALIGGQARDGAGGARSRPPGRRGGDLPGPHGRPPVGLRAPGRLDRGARQPGAARPGGSALRERPATSPGWWWRCARASRSTWTRWRG